MESRVVRATLRRVCVFAWEARGKAGPTPLVVQVAASVTSCRHDAGPAVLDEHR
jgi:hypothetical protein